VLEVTDHPERRGRTLVDPASFSQGRPVELDWFYPSLDGRYVAFGLSEAGDEQSVLHVVEVEGGELLPDRIPFTSFARVAWLPDSSGFYYSGGLSSDFEDPTKFVFFHRLGQDGRAEPEPIQDRDEYFVFPQLSTDGRYLAAVTSETAPRASFVQELPDGSWRPFVPGGPGTCFGVFVDDAYVAVATDEAPRGRLVSVPIATGADRSTWTELVPESEAVLHSVSLAGDRLVLGELVDGYSRIRIVSLHGDPEDEVPLPGAGCVGLHGLSPYLGPAEPPVTTGENEIFFVYSSLTVAPCLYRYDLERRRLDRVSAARRELCGTRASRHRCESRDGVQVPFFLVHRADLDLSRPKPALVYGYGGWNISLMPAYVGKLAPFVEAGGLFVLASLRGDGTYGREWWEDGRRDRKQNTFDDLYSIAESLITQGWTSSDRLAVVGASNGGLLAGAAVAQRPELFGAVVSLVPLLDMVRYTRDPYPAEFKSEYGDARRPSEARILGGYSPYHTIRDGVRYPATLVVSTARDVRCPPWHGRKMVARLHEANASDAPILLRVWQDAGHLAATGGAPEQIAEWLGFIMEQLELDAPGD
jgi:prolyl oligopeptidase